ncbi:MAG: alpha/beta fold hydrolase [Polyangiaceae bacterium]
MFARRGRVRLYYEVLGSNTAPPLLMVRGLARTARHWGSIVDALAAHFRVVVFDNRGIGRSSVPIPPYSTAAMADDAAAVLDATGIDSAHVFGVSLGGMIVQQLAVRHPARVRTLVLGCTRAGRSAPRLPVNAVASLVGAMRLSPEHAVVQTAPLILSRGFLAKHPEVPQRWAELARREPPTRAGVMGQLLAAARHDATAHLPKLKMPVLAITGDVDRLIPPSCSEDLVERIPSAQLKVLPGAGHDFPTEQPERTAALLADFCR